MVSPEWNQISRRMIGWSARFTEALEHRPRNYIVRKHLKAIETAIAASSPRWHERAWVVQEFVNAKKTVMCYGSFEVALEASTFIHLYALQGIKFDVQDLLLRLVDMSDLRAKNTGFDPLDPPDLCYATRSLLSSRAATHPRDKVYSFLGVTHPVEARMVVPDYTKPCVQVYAEATFASVVARNSLDILEFVKFSQVRMDELPTWAVDFRLDQTPAMADVSRIAHGATWHEAVSFPAMHPRLSEEGKHLRVSGSIIGIVDLTVQSAAKGIKACDPELASGLLYLLQTLVRALSGDDCDVSDRIGQDLFAISGLPPSTDKYRTFGDVDDRSMADSDVRDMDEGADEGVATLGGMLLRLTCWWYENVEPDANTRIRWKAFHRLRSMRKTCQGKIEAQQEYSRSMNAITEFWQYAKDVADSACVYSTYHGSIGLAPSTIARGDVVALVVGSKLPMIMRRKDGAFAFRGFAYLFGSMHGETEAVWQEDGVDLKDITLC
ncbi:hypothetical protein LTR85_006049 [Meristemomyces frigidus]|nr:hypothetical protein LTR85_006049 [Meristemomyces frigidus]